MQEFFKSAVEAFVTNNLENIKKFAGWFAKATTMNIIKDNKEELSVLCKDYAYMSSDIEFEQPLKTNKDFYMGYISAYNNIARKVLDNSNELERIDLVVQELPKLRLKGIINYLGEKGFAQQGELAEYLGITASHLWNILNNSSIKQLDILNVHKIGKHVIYGLNKSGKLYYYDKISENKKQYSKKDIMNILHIVTNSDKLDISNFIKESMVLDEALIKEVYMEIFSNRVNTLLNTPLSTYKDNLLNIQKYPKQNIYTSILKDYSINGQANNDQSKIESAA